MNIGDLKLGDFYWHQLSMWDCPPQDGISAFEKFNDTSDLTFHFVLKRVTEVTESGSISTVFAKPDEIKSVPNHILYERGRDLYTRTNHKATKYAPN